MKVIYYKIYDFILCHPPREKRGFDQDSEGWARCRFCGSHVSVSGQDWWCDSCDAKGHDPVKVRK